MFGNVTCTLTSLEKHIDFVKLDEKLDFQTILRIIQRQNSSKRITIIVVMGNFQNNNTMFGKLAIDLELLKFALANKNINLIIEFIPIPRVKRINKHLNFFQDHYAKFFTKKINLFQKFTYKTYEANTKYFTKNGLLSHRGECVITKAIENFLLK